MKLNRAITIISKLRHNANLEVLKLICHSLFSSHLFYGPQLWGEKNLNTQTTFQTLQNSALTELTFKKRRGSGTCIYKHLKLLQCKDHITQEICFLCSH